MRFTGFENSMSKQLGLLLAVWVLCLFSMPTLPTSAAEASSSDPQALQELSLNDLQDIGILLANIREDAINMYEEAARVRLALNASPDIPDINAIPVKLSGADVLPARREWLVYYLGTMEPVIRELGNNVTDVQKGMRQLVIPDSFKAVIEPLWEDWQKNVAQLNHHLDDLVPLFDDAPHNNEKIRNVAVQIFDDTNRLENTRRTIFVALQRGEKRHPEAKIMISP